MPLTEQGDIPRDIAIGIIITMAIFALMAVSPILSMFAIVFVPLPILFYRSKLGRRIGAIIPIGSILIMAVLYGGIGYDILVFLELMLIGYVLADCFERKFSIEKSVACTCLAVMISGVAGLMFHGNLTGIRIGEMVAAHMDQSLTIFIQLYEEMGAPEESLRILTDKRAEFHYMMVRILPGFTMVFVLVVTWITLLIGRPLLKARKLPCPDYGPLNTWRVPEYLVWGAIGSVLAVMVGDNTLTIFGMNALIVLIMIYFLGGIAIVSFYFEKFRVPFIVRLFLYIFLMQGAVFIVVGLGFFDMWLNFRKLGMDTPQQ